MPFQPKNAGAISNSSVKYGPNCGFGFMGSTNIAYGSSDSNGQADLILTLNLRDFPPRVLAPLGLRALAPDPVLLGLMPDHPAAVTAEITRVHHEAERLAGTPLPLRAFLKRATLPRLARALASPA